MGKTRRSPADLKAVLQVIDPVEVWISAADIEDVPAVVAEKDRHVIAAAVRGGADFLVSFDRRHITAPEIRENVSVRVGDAGKCLSWLRKILA